MTRSKRSVYERSCARFTALVFLGDLLFVFSSMLLGHVFRFEYFSEFGDNVHFPEVAMYWNHFCLGLLLYVVIAHNQNLYEWPTMLSRARTVATLLKVAMLWSFSVVGVALMLEVTPSISRFFMVLSTGLLFALLVVWRIAMHWVQHRTRWFEDSYRHMVIVGTGPDARELASRVREGRCDLHRFVGYIATSNHRREDDAELVGENMLAHPGICLGDLDQLEDLMQRGKFDSLAVVDVDLPRSALVRIAKLCERNFIEFKAVPKSFEVFASCLSIRAMAGVPMMQLMDVPQNRILNRAVKRMVDVAGALVGIAVSLPIYAVLVPLIKRESPGPVFYRQIRVGQGGKEFNIYKLRSMRTDAEVGGKVGWSTVDDPRRTKIGTFMRRWNLDEIPQFWNVLRGDMSLVGPRPERPELIKDFVKEIPYYQSRHTVKPGMTGWAQVHGLRGDTSIEERIRYDLQYIERWNVWLDLTIQIKTFFHYKGAC